MATRMPSQLLSPRLREIFARECTGPEMTNRVLPHVLYIERALEIGGTKRTKDSAIRTRFQGNISGKSLASHEEPAVANQT